MRWFILILIYLLIDIYAFQAVRTVIRNPWVTAVYFLISIGVLVALYYELSLARTTKMMQPPGVYILGIFLIVMVPKLILVLFMFGEDVVRIIVGTARKIYGTDDTQFMASRRKFVSNLALGIASIPFASLIYGMIKGKYDYRVLKYELEFEDLPEEFDGYKITQLSDIHCGSFDNARKVRYGMRLANQQKSDLILITGDLVNNVAAEAEKWKPLLSSLKAKDGVFSVLGNHDYGDYVHWNNNKEKRENLQRLIELQKEFGWNLLLNENHLIRRNGQKIAVVGVENWGDHGFKKAGDLNLAAEGLGKNDFKILLTHDPSHWEKKVRKDARNYQLTLSGHTHGMQFGIEIPGVVQWSPIQYRYKQWAGIYEDSGRYINVNRGFGFLGYSGRVGIWPEITVIRLKKKRKKVLV